MKIKPIKTEQDYEKALERLDAIFDAAPDTKEGDEAEVLSMLIDNYENIYHPIEAPDPIEAIKIRMEVLYFFLYLVIRELQISRLDK